MRDSEHDSGHDAEHSTQGTPAAAGAERRDWGWTRTATPIGPLLLAATHRGLAHVAFHADERTCRRALTRLE
ncbi:cysteine methyltransferase, partial [Streptomyces natalensis ATCC 27448]